MTDVTDLRSVMGWFRLHSDVEDDGNRPDSRKPYVAAMKKIGIDIPRTKIDYYATRPLTNELQILHYVASDGKLRPKVKWFKELLKVIKKS